MWRRESIEEAPLTLRRIIHSLSALPDDPPLVAYNDLASWIYSVFMDPHRLSCSFPLPKEEDTLGGMPPGVDRAQVREFYSILYSRCPPQLHAHRARASLRLAAISGVPSPHSYIRDWPSLALILFMVSPDDSTINHPLFVLYFYTVYPSALFSLPSLPFLPSLPHVGLS